MDNLLIPIIYDLLLFLMVVILYFCGKEMAKTGKIFSKAGVIAILTFTLNEGLRFGRGIDYNVYGMKFENYACGLEIGNEELLYGFLVRGLINGSMPFQVLIIIQSFLYIVSVLFFLINYRDILHIALPLFILFSLAIFENLIRWYLGYPFFLIGLSYLLKGKDLLYFSFCIIGSLFHVGLLPMVLIYYILFLKKNVLLPPYITIPIYFFMALFVKSDIMMFFADYVNMLTFISERAAGYAEHAEKWLVSGALELRVNPFDSISTLVYLAFIVWYGYFLVKDGSHDSIFVYNLFILGFIFKPLANQIELMQRYNYLLYFFGSIVAAIVFCYNAFVAKKTRIRLMILAVILSFNLNYLRKPFLSSYDKYLYVWDQGNKTYQGMHSFWINVIIQNSKSQ